MFHRAHTRAPPQLVDSSHHLLVRALTHKRQQHLLANQAAPDGVDDRDGKVEPHRVVCGIAMSVGSWA